LIVNVVDASNLERNLYLTLQLIELRIPVLLVLNMIDLATKDGAHIHTDRLNLMLGVPVVQTAGKSGEGLEAVGQMIVDMVDSGFAVIEGGMRHFDRATIKTITAIQNDLTSQDSKIGEQFSLEWVAIRLLEKDEGLVEFLCKNLPQCEDFFQKVRQRIEELEKDHDDESSDITIAESRYDRIHRIYDESVHSGTGLRYHLSDRIDAILTNRWFGIPAFFGMMYLAFFVAFRLGHPLVQGMEWTIDQFGTLVSGFWAPGSDSLLRALLVDGVIGGVGSVLVFLPNILLLFLAISLLESTGYMARAAFIMDRAMRKIGGIQGKCCIPLLLGFGCTVPAIMATRTLSSRRDRLITMLVAPLMSCGARLPVYTLIANAFFPPREQAIALWGIYVIGIVLAVVSAKLLATFLFRDAEGGTMLELPPYQIPTLKSILQQTWERCWMFLRKAGTLILAASVILWTLTTFPQKKEYSVDYQAQMAQIETQAEASKIDETDKQAQLKTLENQFRSEEFAYTIAGRMGTFLEPVVEPIGFDRNIATALIGAAAAKEIFVSQMQIAYSVGSDESNAGKLGEILQEHYTPLQGFCVMLFCLIGLPCIGTFAVVRQESETWRWPIIQWLTLTGLAYIITLLVFQIGRALGG
jgi:ferrous iron transport protein B